MKRKEPTLSNDPVYWGASSSSTSPHVGDCEGETKKPKGNECQVFLSFRAEDTGKGFTDYLYTSLVDAGVHAFRDSSELCVGEEIGPELLCTITQSKISIPVISENYSSSKRCLLELAQILKCKKSGGQIVLPIFYRVHPLELKCLTGTWADAVRAHRQDQDVTVVNEWEEAVREVGSMEKWESEKTANGHEGALVQIVVRRVMSELKGLLLLDVPEQPEGNDYEVFLSFRGPDTRKGFTDYLYSRLVDAGIRVFRDDNELRVGEEIGPELLRTITQSKISIPIISENYTSSKWCLLELVQILKCKRSGGQIVLPMFYRVQPLQLRRLPERWADAIRAHRKNLDETVVNEWEEALKAVSFLKGWESEKIDNGHEGSLAKIVVREVMSRLKITVHPKEFVGIDNHVEKIMSEIGAKFDNTKIIGIYGMDGIGKTTLARVIYNNLSNHFEHCSFIANIANIVETNPCKGIECLQKQLIYDILKVPHDVSNVYEGLDFIKTKFGSRKVIVLLDDVGNNDHLEALAGDGRSFKRGSIVIITTRNKDILDKARARPICQLNDLPLEQSLILFSRHAFGKDSPPGDFEVISRDIVSITGGLPLALKVIGSSLWKKTIGIFEDTLERLKKAPNRKVQDKLMITYEALGYVDKQIFLDIACFFIGSSKQSPSYMWAACGFSPMVGIDVLNAMSLIKVDKDSKLTMNNQLRDLGRAIVQQENIKKPQKRSRLWIYEDAIRVLDGNKGTSYIEALCIDKNGHTRSFTGEQFKELTDLRFLQVKAANLAGDFQDLLPKLRWLQWKDCPSDFTVANFHPKKLVVLDLSWSEILDDWGGWGPFKMAAELKVLNLSGRSLRRSPNLSGFKNLEILVLEDCENLTDIHPSIADIMTLVTLIVRRCWRLEWLPNEVSRMGKLKELLINDTAIREIPISSGLMKLEMLEILCASSCDYLARLPESMGSLVSLTQLDLSHSRIEELPESMSSLVSLTQLDLSHSRIKELPESLGSLVSLTQLDLSHSRIEELPASLGSLVSLAHLDLSHSRIEELPESIGSLKELETLDASNCQLLAHLPSSICDLASLQRLLLQKCDPLSEIPESIGMLTSLIELDLQSTAIAKLPESISSLKKLRSLDASHCILLTRIPNSIGDLASLSFLDLRFCQSLAQLPDSIGSLLSLQRLLLEGCRSLKKIPCSIENLAWLTELNLKHTAIMELPVSIGSLKELKTLNASYCASLANIPSSIGHLTSLSVLDLRFCRKLAQLPESIGSLVSLQRLLLQKCYSLTKIPDSIGRLESLSELNLRCTGIVELPESSKSLNKLETLDASYCASLARIPSSIGHLTSLSLLDLRKCCKLAQLPDSIGSLMSLQRLLLGQCRSLREIPYSIGKLASLIELDLRSTKVAELPTSIGRMQKLKSLNIQGTPMTELPNAIQMRLNANI